MTVAEIEVRDAVSPMVFDGTLLVDRSWDVATARAATGSGPTRWTDMLLYLADECHPFKYVLQIVGRSLVYHRPGECHKKGAVSTVEQLTSSDLYMDLEPCKICGPEDLDDLPLKATVSVEQARFTLHTLDTAADLMDVLRMNSRDGKRGNISGLGAQLLYDAKEKDAEIAAEMNKPKRL